MTELAPCPFCGGEVEIKTYRDEGWEITCPNHDWPKGGSRKASDLAADIGMYTWGLGDEAKQALITAWNTRAAPGGQPAKLTAEQVREAIERHVKFYEGGDYDEQAIADELNAALGLLEVISNDGD